MEQTSPFFRISELLSLANEMQRPVDSNVRCQHLINLIEETFWTIDAMSNREREDIMSVLTGWMLTQKFGIEGRPALSGVQKYCIAECLMENPNWEPRSFNAI